MFISELLLLNFLVGLGPGVSLLCSSLFLFDLKRKMKSIMCNLGYVVVSHVKVCLLLDPYNDIHGGNCVIQAVYLSVSLSLTPL